MANDETAWAVASAPGTLVSQGKGSMSKALNAVQNALSEGHIVVAGPQKYVDEFAGNNSADDMELTRESVEAMDEGELDEMLEAHGLEAKDFKDENAKREAVMKTVFTDL